MSWINNDTLLDAVLVTGAGAAKPMSTRRASFQGTVVGTGAVAATIVVQVSNDVVATPDLVTNWLTLGTITLSGTTSATDGFAINAAWRYVRGNVTAISGTGAAATLDVAAEK